MAGTKLTSGCWLLLVVSVGAVACTGSDGREDGSEQPSAPAPAAVDFAAPDGDALPRGVRPGDQTDQSLSGVAASEDVVVAVGSDYSANVHLPLFLTSVDGGEH